MSTNNKWGALSMRDRAFLIREAVRNGITDIDSIRDTWEHRFDGTRDTIIDGGTIPSVVITPNSRYTKFVNSLPDNQRNTPESEYYTHLGWELYGKPKDFEEAKQRGMYNFDNSDQRYHGNSVAWDGKTDIGYFLKPKHHETVKYELDWYNKGLETLEGGRQRPLTGKDREFWQDFKSKYKLDESGNGYKYIPRQHTFDGESNQPTEAEYIAQRAEEKRSEALLHARNRKETIQPYIEKGPTYKEYELEELRIRESALSNLYKKADRTAKLILSYDDFGVPKLTKVIDPVYQSAILQYQDAVNHAKIECSKSHTHGPGCLATVMDDYDKTETWNKRFSQDPRKSGFIEIDQKDILPGDIVQFGDYYRDTETGAKTEWEPIHAMMANTSYNEVPKAVKFNGSNGGDAVRINSSYPVDSWEDNTKAFRFVGDKADSLQWKKEYREKYGHQFSGEDDTQEKTYISKKPKNNIKTGNVEFDLFDFDTWRYHNAPTYSEDTDFTLSFTDALLDGEKYFKWGDNYYSTEVDYNKKFTAKKGKKSFEEFADYMYPAVLQVLQENKMPVDMAHNVVRQAALESDYGLSPRGERGFNLSGIKWTKKAGDAGYKYTIGADGEKYIDFKDLKEYINYKIHTLHNNYDALNASSVADYVEALHPKAFKKKPRSKNYKGDYSSGAKNYKKSMTGMSSLDKTLMNELYFPLFRK